MFSLFVFKSTAVGMRYGMGTYISQLTNSLIKFPGVNIYVVNYNSEEVREFTVYPIREGITDIYIPATKLGKYDENIKQKYAFCAVTLLDETISKTTNVVFLMNTPSTFPFAKLLKEKYGYPIVSMVHLARWQQMLNGNKYKFVEIWKEKNDSVELKRLIEEREFYKLSDKIVSVTGYMKEFLRQFYDIPEEKISVIRNGVNSRTFKIIGEADKASIKKRLGFGTDEKIILYSGRLDASKGLKFVLEAFNEVTKQNTNARLVLMGDDSGTERFSQYLSYCDDNWGKVTFTGLLNHEKVLSFYQIADIGIMTSIYDHCPYVALEMIGHNVPLIISNIEGLNEILSSEQAVYIEPLIDNEGDISFSPEEISGTILSLLGDEERRERITSDYPDLMKDKFSDHRMAGEMYSILNSMFEVVA